MKVAVLTCEMLEGGLLKCEASKSLVPILAKARSVRDSGLLDGEMVRGGVVQASWQPATVMKFRCVTAATVAEAPKKGKRKFKDS